LQDQLINFVDTAGIRRKNRVAGELERAGIQKSLEAIEHSDIILFVLDGKELISSQDKQLGGLLEKHSKSVLVLINKWDLADDNSDKARNEVKEMIYGQFPHLRFAPIVFVSGLTGYRTQQIFPLLIQAWQARQTEITSTDLDVFLKRTIHKHLPSLGRGVRHPELLGLHQLNANPPIFELYIKAKTSVNISYVHFLENRLREDFNFFATPIVIKLTKMKK
jgi:GTP-binding protein